MKKLFVIAFAIILTSCSSSLDLKFNKETLKTDIIEVKKELSKEDSELLGKYILKSVFKEELVTGKTYSEILKAAKEEEEKKKAE